MTLREAVERVRAIPYGRNDERSAAGVLAERRGTCSTKHLLLKELAPEIELWHRVYRLTPEDARRLFGEHAATVVPKDGLTDVHTYATVSLAGRRLTLDVTFPGGELWDGLSDMPVACGPGEDHAAGHDPLATKLALVERHCDPALREPFIRALSDE